MESLKNLPSYNKDNFSNFTQGLSKTTVKSYLKVRVEGSERKSKEIVTDRECLLLKDFERIRERQRLKRSCEGSPSLAAKMSRTDDDYSGESLMLT